MPEPLDPPIPPVICRDPARAAEAAALAGRLETSCAGEPPPGAGGLMLVLTDGRLQLECIGPDAPGPVYAEFVAGRTGFRGRRGAHGDEALARAAGARRGHRPGVIDATAGLGRDAFVLAARGCEVTLIERHPAVHALLADGLRRAAPNPDAGEAVARMTPLCGDARALLAGRTADVVLVDPMHPLRRKSAAVRKEMRLFRALVGADADAAELLAAARAAARERVVVKRPRGADPLDGPAPSGSVEGRSTRFDIYAGRADS